MADKQILLSYLGESQPFEFMNSMRYSTLVAGLRDCRVYTKRNVSTGKHDPTLNFGDEGNWLGAIGYFTILDQIGSCYKLSGEQEPNGNNNKIKFAIEKFGFDLIENNYHQLNALIALRNAFTHDFNLLNTPLKENPQQVHKFTVMAKTEHLWIVKLPSKQWDQNIEGKNFTDTSDTTFINLFGFGNLVETIYNRLIDLVKNDKLETRIPILQLINKYTFITSGHPIE